MSKLRFRISMSLDGFVAGPSQSFDHPLGVGGMRLHEWAFPLAAFREMHGHEGGTTFTFVTEGIEAALERARQAAGDRDVSLSGGASVAGQYLAAGLVDEMMISLVPTLLGSGERLFDDGGDDPHGLELARTIPAPKVVHLKFIRR